MPWQITMVLALVLQLLPIGRVLRAQACEPPAEVRACCPEPCAMMAAVERVEGEPGEPSDSEGDQQVPVDLALLSSICPCNSGGELPLDGRTLALHVERGGNPAHARRTSGEPSYPVQTAPPEPRPPGWDQRRSPVGVDAFGHRSATAGDRCAAVCRWQR